MMAYRTAGIEHWVNSAAVYCIQLLARSDWLLLGNSVNTCTWRACSGYGSHLC